MKIHVPLLSAAEQGAQAGLRAGMKQMLEVSNGLAPKDDEDLVDSGVVRVDDLTGQVSYDAVHALWQHERLDFIHADGGRAKYLETAAEMVDVDEFIARGIGEALGG
ncbi:hypothetical protein ABC195_15140 [Microbacterium sp. 2P01SA-2]|uniref:hypothetical protein n=1 Tax=unclassified Microbacterium TaxID=2609290 RepID=UPI0039A2706F